MEHPLVAGIPPKAGIPFLGMSPIFSCDTEQFPQEKKYPLGITTQQNEEKEHVFKLRKARGLGLYPAQKQVQ
jgi:hypothetical protein